MGECGAVPARPARFSPLHACISGFSPCLSACVCAHVCAPAQIQCVRIEDWIEAATILRDLDRGALGLLCLSESAVSSTIRSFSLAIRQSDDPAVHETLLDALRCGHAHTHACADTERNPHEKH